MYSYRQPTITCAKFTIEKKSNPLIPHPLNTRSVERVREKGNIFHRARRVQEKRYKPRKKRRKRGMFTGTAKAKKVMTVLEKMKRNGKIFLLFFFFFCSLNVCRLFFSFLLYTTIPFCTDFFSSLFLLLLLFSYLPKNRERWTSPTRYSCFVNLFKSSLGLFTHPSSLLLHPFAPRLIIYIGARRKVWIKM